MTRKQDTGWNPGGLEAFVDAPIHDISDREGAPDPDPVAEVFGRGMVLALGKLRQQYGDDLSATEVADRLKTDYPDLAHQAGL